MPKKIQEVTTAIKLIKKFGLVGAFTPQLDESVVAVVITDDLSESDEWRGCWVARIGGAAGAGNFHKFGINNPVNSGVVGVIDEIGWSGDANQSVHMEWPNVVAVLATGLSPLFRDSRRQHIAVPEIPALEATREATAGAELGTDEMATFVLANTTHIYRPDIHLYPGSSIIVRTNVPNILCNYYGLWRERNLRPDGS